MQGRVMQSIGGFYYIEAADTLYTCRARGHFRRQGISPVAGDMVEFSPSQDEGVGSLDEVLPRRNMLVRPPVANVDVLVLVASVCQPNTNTLVLDKMIAMAEKKRIEPVIVINKSDLATPEQLEAIYQKTGLDCYTVTATSPSSLDALRHRLAGQVCVFAGNSGVGKSSLLNALDPKLVLQTGEISQKLGRGRHTTRTATLYHFADGYVVDTPGFSSVDMEQIEPINKDELADCFREFEPYVGRCRFTGCAHYREPNCAVRQAVETGLIASSRYESYVAMYEAVKDKKEWET